MKDKGITYQIYGRKAYETPLTLVGEVKLDAEAALNQAVLAEVGAEGWVELVAMPHEAMIYLIEEEGAS